MKNIRRTIFYQLYLLFCDNITLMLTILCIMHSFYNLNNKLNFCVESSTTSLVIPFFFNKNLNEYLI